MSDGAWRVKARAEIEITVDVPFGDPKETLWYANVTQAVQDAIGHTGAVVEDVIEYEEQPVSVSRSDTAGRRMSKSWHGTTGGYTNHKCRCDACRAAWRDDHWRYMQGEQREKHAARVLARYYRTRASA